MTWFGLPFRRRPRLYLALLAGLVASVLTPRGWHASSRLVVGWDCLALVYLGLMLQMAWLGTQDTLRQRAGIEDPTRWLFLALMSGAALFSMFAVLGVMHEAKAAGGTEGVLLIILAAGTVLLSWLLAHGVFAVHYAHEYYKDLLRGRDRGLDFPGDHDDPDYWDFLYFSFVIGMTAQVSDVQVRTKSWRRLVLAHGLMSFLFNTVVLALSINLLASLF